MSHQQSRLTWVAGAFLFSERDDQSLLSPQRPASLEIRLHPRVDPGVYDIRNAASATIRGVEVENTSRLGHGVEAGGRLTWLDATYDHYIAVAAGGATGDVLGNRLNNAPSP